MSAPVPKINVLSNVYGEPYHALRGEEVDRCLSWTKRRDLFDCLEKATGREVVILSSPPKATRRRRPRWLAPVVANFCGHKQFFCANWDLPKLRIPLSWLFYARHVLKHTRSGDMIMIDNYEILYIIAALWVRLFRHVTFVLDYEDGKHLIDRSWSRILSGLAELLGRPLFHAALLANPSLGQRLAPEIPKELVPGFIEAKNSAPGAGSHGLIRFLYSGTLDQARGVDLLMKAVGRLPASGWELHITGLGPLEEEVAKLAQDPGLKGRVTFHHSLPSREFGELLKTCQVGLNCQKVSDPISEVTFPSKVFAYLANGLLVLSSRASGVEGICGRACYYYVEETSEALAGAMIELINNFGPIRAQLDAQGLANHYSIDATAQRLARLFRSSQLIESNS